MIGQTAGKYRVVAQLGRGAMGTVFRAVDETLGREVAIKVLNPEFAGSRFIQRFQTEATTLARLNHPGIATLYELFQSGPDLLMVMEFVRGETLEKVADRAGALAPERAAHIIDKVLAALAYAHQAGVVHCDIKPANVMVTQHGGVKVMDFGVARVRGVAQGADGYLAGTPAYVAPEVVLGQTVDSRADLYSVGVLFYRLLTGVLPFSADTATGMVQKQILETPVPASVHREGLPVWCDTILQRALAKSPADRFQTAEEFREALARAAGLMRTELTQGLSDLARMELTLPDMLQESSVAVSGAPSAAEAANAPAAVGPATIVVRRERRASGWSIAALVIACAALVANVALRRSAPAPAAASVGVAPAQTSDLPAFAQGFGGSAEARLTTRASESGKVGPTGAAAAASVGDAVPADAPSDGGAGFSSGAAGSGAASSGAAPAPKTAPARQAAVQPVAAQPRPEISVTPAATIVNAADPSAGEVARPATPVPIITTVPFVFEAKALMRDGGRRRMRDARIVLADGKINIQADEDNHVLYAIPFRNIVSISYSQGRDPLWNTATGPTRVARADGGVLGIFRVTRFWVSLRTNDRDSEDQFLPLLLSAELRAKRAVAALEERTGRRAEFILKEDD